MDYSRDIPIRGEHVLTCSHRSKSLHWYRFSDVNSEIVRNDGRTFQARWACLCDACHILLPHTDLTTLVERDFILGDDVDFAEGN
jgi:hypothetical protein